MPATEVTLIRAILDGRNRAQRAEHLRQTTARKGLMSYRAAQFFVVAHDYQHLSSVEPPQTCASSPGDDR